MKELVVVSVVGVIAVAAASVAATGSGPSVRPAGRRRGPRGQPARQGRRRRAARSGPVTVEAVKVETLSLPQTITAVGSLRSDESVTLRPEVAGRISAIGFQEGQRVAKGSLLVQLDTAVPEAEVQQARANLTLARTKYNRAVDLPRATSSRRRRGTRPRTPQDFRGHAPARRGEARQDADAGAVLGNHRPPLGVGGRLRQGRRRPRQPRVDRSAEGRFPRARGLLRQVRSVSRCRCSSTRCREAFEGRCSPSIH